VSEPRKHHYVPQTYQRGLARKKRKALQVRVLNKTTGDGGIRNVEDTFARRDWNTMLNDDGIKEFGVERLLAEYIDQGAAPALEAARQLEFPLTDPDRVALAMFMAAQLSRGRAVREGLRHWIVETHRLMLRQTAAHASDEQIREITGRQPLPGLREMLMESERHIEINPSNALLLHGLFESVADLAEILDMRTWTLVHFAWPCLFTGEHPFVHINPRGDTVGYGIVTAEQLYLPVSPTAALLLSHPWTSWPDDRVNGTVELATRMSWAMLIHPSNEEVLLHPDVERHPLPAPGLMLRRGFWPWGEDPEASCGPPPVPPARSPFDLPRRRDGR
jgi:hypothetical protein